jgi:hypothetical protein
MRLRYEISNIKKVSELRIMCRLTSRDFTLQSSSRVSIRAILLDLFFAKFDLH